MTDLLAAVAPLSWRLLRPLAEVSAGKIFRRFISISMVMMFVGLTAYACLNNMLEDIPNGYQGTVSADKMSASTFIQELTSHRDRRNEYWNDWTAPERSSLTHDLDYYRNNWLAVLLVHRGRHGEAISILEEIENTRPGKYATAANLGTAYELNGENEKAIQWIQEGINRNRHSHQSTEWLHVKILEAKLALARDPAWLRRHNVLGVGFGEGARPQLPGPLPVDHRGESKSPSDIEAALIYQLTERLEFTRGRDPLVADLLFDLGNVLMLTTGNEHARAVYGLSLDYGSTHVGLTEKRLKFIETGVAEEPASVVYWLAAFAGLFVVATGVIIKLKVSRSHSEPGRLLFR